MANTSSTQRSRSNNSGRSPQRRTTSGSSSRSTSSRSTSSRSTNSRSSGNSSRRSAPAPRKEEPSDFFSLFRKSKLFAPLLTIVIIVVGVLLDVLFAWNNYDRFFLILGIELIVVAILWIVLLLINIGSEVIKE